MTRREMAESMAEEIDQLEIECDHQDSHIGGNSWKDGKFMVYPRALACACDGCLIQILEHVARNWTAVA